MKAGYAPYTRTKKQAAGTARTNFLLRAVAGLTQPNQAGGFFGGLQAGLGGSFGQGLQAEQDAAAAQKQAEDEKLRNDLNERLFGLQERGVVADEARARADLLRAGATKEQNVSAMPWYEALPDDNPLKAQYRADALRAPASAEPETDYVAAMDEATLRMTALNYAKTGMLPPLGMGKKGAEARVKILEYAAHNYPALDVAANKADYSKNQRALTDLQKLYDSSTAFEATANANSDVLAETANSIPDYKTRFGNRIGRAIATQMGDPKVAQFNTALETVKPEFARLLSSPGAAGGQLTDTARKEMSAVMGGDFTKSQLLHSLAILKRDAKNRREAYSKQIDQIRARLAWNQSGANPNFNVGGAGQPQGDVHWVMDANGNLVQAP
jgi:hypothetical protein